MALDGVWQHPQKVSALFMAKNLPKTSKLGVFGRGLICDSVRFECSSTSMGYRQDAHRVASSQELFGSPIPREDPVSKTVSTYSMGSPFYHQHFLRQAL